MTRLMLDSTTAADIPEEYEGRRMELVAGYVNDPRVTNARWNDTDWDRFPAHVRRVRICVYTDRYDAQVIDVEEGNCTAKQAVAWIRAKWERGETPTVYCYSAAGPLGYRVNDVRLECDAAGVKRPLIWIAHFAREWVDFDPSGDSEIIALQYDGSAETDSHFDASAVANFWPGVDPAKTVATEHVLPAIYLQRLSLGYNAWTGEPIDPKGELPDYAKPPAGWVDPYK